MRLKMYEIKYTQEIYMKEIKISKNLYVLYTIFITTVEQC